MLEQFKNIPEDVRHIIWLFIVSFIGGFIGFATKTHKTLANKNIYQKIYVLFISIISSMFIAYITFELIITGTNNQRLAIAIAGFAAYSGTDLLIILQERIIEKIKSKIDNF